MGHFSEKFRNKNQQNSAEFRGSEIPSSTLRRNEGEYNREVPEEKEEERGSTEKGEQKREVAWSEEKEGEGRVWTRRQEMGKEKWKKKEKGKNRDGKGDREGKEGTGGTNYQ